MAGLRVVRPLLPGAHARSAGLLVAGVVLLCGLAGPSVALATPVATFKVDPASPQTNQAATLTADQADNPAGLLPLTYTWSADGGAALDSTSGRTVHITFPTAGVYQVTLTVSDPGDPMTGTATGTQAITATDPPPPPNAAPTASFTFSPPDPRVGSPVMLTSTSTDDGTLTKFEWDLDGNGTYEVVGSSTRQVTFNAGGWHTVGLRVTDDGGLQGTFAQTIYVDQRPSASLDVTPATAAVGDAVTFTSTSTDPEGDPLTFAWDLDHDGLFNDGTGDSAQRTYAAPGTYPVRLRVTDSHGASSTATGQVRVVADVAPQAGFSFTPTAPRAGQPVTFTSTSTDSDGTVAALQWDLDGDGQFDDAAGATAQRAFSPAGSYTVSLRVTDDKGISSIAFQTISVLGSATQEQDAPAGSTPGTSAPDALPPAAPVPSPGTSSTRPSLLSPFPIVRIRGRADATAVQVDLLSVQAPRGSRISARCRGASCPRRAIATTAISSSRTVRLRGLERRYGNGAVLEIRVTKPGRIGKYTTFSMRRGRAPLRRDLCLRPGATRPSRCPTQ